MIGEFRGVFAFLSNFFLCNFQINDIPCVSAESAFQAAKTLNPIIKRQIAQMPPKEAKAAGFQRLSGLTD